MSSSTSSAAESAPPRVSVVIPVYNRARYVGAAIESILGQSFGDFELIVVDDGSSDETRAVVGRYADPRLRLVCLDTNQGVARARNAGVEQARGEYVAFLDSDDTAFPDRLGRQVAFLERHPECAAVGAWIDWMDDRGRPLGRVKRKPVAAEEIAAQRLFRSGLENSASMARTAILRHYGHHEGYDVGEDFDLWARVAADYPLANLAEVLVRRRSHEERTTREKAATIRAQRQAIYASQLAALGVPFDERDLERHFLLRRMHKLGFRPDRDYLDWAEAWLTQLAAANRRAPRYPEPAFSRVLGGFWLKLCWRALPALGWTAWRRFWGSPLKAWAWGGLWREMALKAPRPFSHPRRLGSANVHPSATGS